MPEKDVWIAVPTYWTHPAGVGGDELTIFDHPTPLDAAGTLGRTLDSFRNLDCDFHVLVVAAAAHPDLGEAVHERVAALLKPFAGAFPLSLASPAVLDALNGALPEPILRLDSYGNIRNVQLAVPFAMGADAVVGIDDDEVIEDRGYLAKVRRYVGEPHGDGVVGGMAGPYFDRTGAYQLPGAADLVDVANIFIKKNYFMNEALKRVMEGPCPDGIVRSNVAFGGNMCMARGTIARVCHDPYIPRGEDYDYVLNAAMEGILFYFQPAMGIVHLPPDATGPQAADKASKMIADIRRFIYMQEKVRAYTERFPDRPLDRDYLYPYPGPYLEPNVDLQSAGVRALDELYPEYRRQRAPEDLVAEATETARREAAAFFDYREHWKRMTAAIDDSPALRRIIEGMRIGCA